MWLGSRFGNILCSVRLKKKKESSMRNTFQKKQVIKYPKRTSPLSNQ